MAIITVSFFARIVIDSDITRWEYRTEDYRVREKREIIENFPFTGLGSWTVAMLKHCILRYSLLHWFSTYSALNLERQKWTARKLN